MNKKVIELVELMLKELQAIRGSLEPKEQNYVIKFDAVDAQKIENELEKLLSRRV